MEKRPSTLQQEEVNRILLIKISYRTTGRRLKVTKSGRREFFRRRHVKRGTKKSRVDLSFNREPPYCAFFFVRLGEEEEQQQKKMIMKASWLEVWFRYSVRSPPRTEIIKSQRRVEVKGRFFLLRANYSLQKKNNNKNWEEEKNICHLEDGRL